MDLPTYFSDFLSQIRPSDEMREAFKNAHNKLRRLLFKDADLADSIVTTFLQGSYRRATAIRPVKSTRPDVDVVVVTKLDKNACQPKQALARFKPFLQEHYVGSWGNNSRSLHITDTFFNVDLDLVITSAPSIADTGILSSHSIDVEPFSEIGELWKLSPLEIPDQEADRWQRTHPLAQIAWTVEKNSKTLGHYVNVVKALKWWRRITPEFPAQPKSYPLEHMIGLCCPDEVKTVGSGIVRTLESICKRYGETARNGEIPFLSAHGIINQNVFSNVSTLNFQQFLEHVKQAHDCASRALVASTVAESAQLWRTLFGDVFPDAEDGSGKLAGYRGANAKTGAGRFG